ncbi:MAG: hypothetical protein ACI82A_002829 [Candidatus Azotimanducaceae bacterium]|jgi:hypothetical protein
MSRRIKIETDCKPEQTRRLMMIGIRYQLLGPRPVPAGSALVNLGEGWFGMVICAGAII